MLEVVADACINGKTVGERPVVLNEPRVPGCCETGGGISERLPILIGLTVLKRIESGEGVNRSKTFMG